MSAAPSMITRAERVSGTSANPGRSALDPRSTVGSDNLVFTVSSIASAGSTWAAASISRSAKPDSRLFDLAADVMTSLADPTAVPVDLPLIISNIEPGDARRQTPRQRQPSPAAPPASMTTPNDASTSAPLRDPFYSGDNLSPQLRNPLTLLREHTPVVSTFTLASPRSSPSRRSARALIEPPEYCYASHAEVARTSPNAEISERAGCNDAASIGSSRSWVRDADSSSLCSRRSSCWSSTDYETEDLEDGEVYKPGIDSDVPEFLDRRPEPPGAQIWIDRDDPRQLVVYVTLPGFSLENITVAFRRHHRLHVLADQYGENGGHYERTISLGPDVSSRSNRAAFDGTTLRIFIDRRAPRPRVPPTTAMLVAGSPTSSSTSFSLPSPLLDASLRSTVSFLGDEPTDAPIAMCSTGPLETKQRSRSVTGPEGAKAAARAARDEAMQRAKEAYQSMLISKIGRKLPFRGERKDLVEDEDVFSPSDRSGTIKRHSHSLASTSSSANSISSQPTSANSSASDASSPSRPASMGRSLTLRPREAQTFVQASVLANGAVEQLEASTPKFEKTPEECELLRALSV